MNMSIDACSGYETRDALSGGPWDPSRGTMDRPRCRLPLDHGLRTRRGMTELSGRLATAIVGRYRERFGRGPTESKAYITDDVVFVVLRSAQTEVERSLVAGGEVESVELLRRRIRQMAADEFCEVTEQIVGRKVVAMLGDHNAVANASVLVFLLERPEPVGNNEWQAPPE